ncbi:MAG: MogA/MoaB family molybdenum cofactor biosynthesis protein [Desulfovibrionaceae bacterium]|nr:MogA/MoaB family molybdenum cofactor biosynthesis protein [Desulfovibrionaceae bacterium]
MYLGAADLAGPEDKTPAARDALLQVEGVLLAPCAPGGTGPAPFDAAADQATDQGAGPCAGASRWPVLRALDRVELSAGRFGLELWRAGVSVAWITLSDKGAAGLRADKSGPAVEAACRKDIAVSLARGFLLPDEPAALRALVARLAWVEGFDLIVTTGGTGLAPRDGTPEAVAPLLERRLPGFEQAMMAASLAKTPRAAISRAVAGTVGGSILVALPGSPKAVAENLVAVLPAVEHALDKLQGDPADCAA